MCGEANRTFHLKTYVPYVPTRDGRHSGRKSLIWFIRHLPAGGSAARRARPGPRKGASRTLH